MADFSKFIPEPVANVEDLARLVDFWNEEVCKKEQKGKSYIYSVVLGTEGDDAGKNLVWFKDSKTEPLAPKKLKEFPITLSDQERRKAITDFEAANKLERRSSAIVLLGGEKKWVVLFDPASAEEQAPPSGLAPVAPAEEKKVPSGPAPVAPTEDKKVPSGPAPVAKFVKTRARVSNRGVPPPAFLQELVEWGKTAPAEIFADKPTKEKDVYASVQRELAPYGDLLHRKACMLEVMRVLAGFESSWDWTEGRDTKNTSASGPQNEIEAGAWQVSSNSIPFGTDLKTLVLDEVKTTDAVAFQVAMKANHPLAMEYIARLLRHTIRANGPVKRSEINEWLSTDAVKEFQQLLAT